MEQKHYSCLPLSVNAQWLEQQEYNEGDFFDLNFMKNDRGSTIKILPKPLFLTLRLNYSQQQLTCCVPYTTK